MDRNALDWLFSTAPQALATLVGLIFTGVAFILGAIDKEVVEFITVNQRNPSKYYPEEKLMVHFLKRGRKLMNAGEMPDDRVEKFKELLALCEHNKRKNQYR